MTTLNGRCVRLEPLAPRHAPGVLAAADDDAIFTWLSVARPRNLDEAEQMVATYLNRQKLETHAQIDQRSGEVLGVTSYYDIDETLRTRAIGHTWLSRRAWRTAVNTEAKLLLLTHAFESLDCVRIVWQTDLRNERSQRAIERLGAVREGVLRKHRIRRDGTWRDTVTYSMLDEEWPRAKQRLQARLDGRDCYNGMS